MKWQELEELARKLSAEEVRASVASLAADGRFAAVVRLLQDQKDLAADYSCSMKWAEHHGCLAHAAGVRYGMIEVEGRIKQALEKRNESRK